MILDRVEHRGEAAVRIPRRALRGHREPLRDAPDVLRRRTRFDRIEHDAGELAQRTRQRVDPDRNLKRRQRSDGLTRRVIGPCVVPLVRCVIARELGRVRVATMTSPSG